MEVPREQLNTGPSGGEQGARIAVLVFMTLSLLSLAFGLGWLLNGMDDSPAAPKAGPTGANSSTTAAASDQFGGALLDEIYQTLKSQYVDKELITPEKLRTAAIDGIIASLNDPHSSYISPQDVQAGALELNSSYQGIGASVSDRSGQVQIVAPFRDSPAEAAGIKAGDVILAVDGDATDGWSDQQAVQRIRGPKGTKVTLKVRHLDGTVQTIEVVRGEIPIKSVFTEPNLETIPGESGDQIVDRDGNPASDIAYIAISQFHDTTVKELRTALQGIESKGYKGLILDLRGNPGGLLTATVDVADEFLSSGVILTEEDADGQKKSWSAKPGGLATKIPIVILQDRGSASGSEVLAGALHDAGRAKIVGTRSFGKGTVNLPVTLKQCGQPTCGILYISIGRWLSPNGDAIEGVGIKPDIELPMTAEEYIDQGDLQVFKAIDVLRGK
jgi:carboxyl-terminal processing protease